MIQQDLAFTLGSAPGFALLIERLATDNRRLNGQLEAVRRASHAACRGAKLISVHGQSVVMIGGDEWRELRLALIDVARLQPDERAPMN